MNQESKYAATRGFDVCTIMNAFPIQTQADQCLPYAVLIKLPIIVIQMYGFHLVITQTKKLKIRC